MRLRMVLVSVYTVVTGVLPPHLRYSESPAPVHRQGRFALDCPQVTPALHPPSSTRQHDAPGSGVSWMWARPCRAATHWVVNSSTLASGRAGRTSPGAATRHRMNFGSPSPRPGSWTSSRHGAG